MVFLEARSRTAWQGSGCGPLLILREFSQILGLSRLFLNPVLPLIPEEVGECPVSNGPHYNTVIAAYNLSLSAHAFNLRIAGRDA